MASYFLTQGEIPRDALQVYDAHNAEYLRLVLCSRSALGGADHPVMRRLCVRAQLRQVASKATGESVGFRR
jgi:hypothetical protein